ncbi:MAG: flagellar filament capping protein FliD [Candidatus Gastranaerophilales bacterium]|nr:flagellar filament capping protein FliD [Candidatus Gastranaerophilales bacterium]
MSISFSGVGSGLDTSSWVEALVALEKQKLTSIQTKITNTETQQTALNTLKTKATTLKSTVKAFTDSNIISAFDIFNRKGVSVSETKYLTATASNNTALQNFNINIKQLATPTAATGQNSLGLIADTSTKIVELNNGVVNKGTVSVYINNKKSEFEVTKDTTVEDLFSWIDGLTEKEGSAFINSDGKFEMDLTDTDVTDVKLGASNDTGNLWSFLSLNYEYDEEGDLTSLVSTKKLNQIKQEQPMVGNAANFATPVTAGTFKIGDAEFTIDSSTSLNGLIYQINNNPDANVTANYDAIENRLIIKSKDPGATTINIEAGTSNFTQVAGLTTEAGELTAKSQSLGKNAIVEINGTTFETASNTLNEASTGIAGLTLNLLQTTPTDEPVSVTVTNDTTELTSKIESFVKQYNELQTEVKKATASSGNFKYDSSLNSMLNEITMNIMNIVPGLSANASSMSAIGVSTGKVTTDTDNVSTKLVFDSAKFQEAMEQDPAGVKALFIGNATTEITGVMQKLSTTLDNYLDIENGYFASKKESLESGVKTLNDRLKKKQSYLEAYQARLEKQFQQMDTYIAQLQSQSSYFS